MQAPRLEKIVVNIGIGEAIQNNKALDAATTDLRAITGQKPIVKKAKKSIAQFRLREGMDVGLMVTLRGDRMYEFLDRLVNAALPRLRDFQGVPTRSFDGRGNYSLGLREQLVFPEIDYDKIDKLRGMRDHDGDLRAHRPGRPPAAGAAGDAVRAGIETERSVQRSPIL